jgi:light-regulated signal transduction histidine kinase (bacteriophytochrome)
MRELVREVVAELGLPKAKVELRIGDLPATLGDRTLIRQVWTNLLSNALKYSRDRANQIIEVGGKEELGETTYFVKDNGVGFDMAHAGKLFGAFQRLHSQREFEGFGVGLALVERIVVRHGGRIWAEARVGEGATFRFALPQRS